MLIGRHAKLLLDDLSIVIRVALAGEFVVLVELKYSKPSGVHLDTIIVLHGFLKINPSIGKTVPLGRSQTSSL